MEFTLSGVRVMVVDDDLGIHSLIGELLRHWGCVSMDFLADGADAPVRYQRTRPDLVIMDVEMPGISGPEAARAIKELDPHAVILLLTGVPDGNLARRALQEKWVKAVLPKPFRFDQLRIAIQEALGARHKGGKASEGAVA